MRCEALSARHDDRGELKAKRVERGLSQEELANLSGLHLTAVGRIERAEREPGVRTVCKLAAALGVKPGDLFGRLG